MNRQTFTHERARAKYLVARGSNAEYWLGYCYGLEELMCEVPAMRSEQSAEWLSGHADALVLAGRKRGRPQTDERSTVFSVRIPERAAARLDKKARKNIKKIILDELKKKD
jgi:hypothetical protein